MVTTDQIIDQLSQVLTLKKEDLNPQTTIQDFIRDSMDMVELIAVLSNDYGIQPDLTQLGQVHTIQDIVDLVNKSVPQKDTNF